MNEAKIQLSADELAIVQDARLLLTKNIIIGKVYILFGEVARGVQEMIGEGRVMLPPEAQAVSPKISRGENYEGLPYVMLDYPRLFSRHDIFAVRVMFWWGNYFSITLHLKGIYREKYAPQLVKNLALLAQHDFHICTGKDDWRHELEAGNYIPLQQQNELQAAESISGNDFCKLSSRIPFQQWNRVSRLLAGLYQTIFTSLGY